MEKLKETIKLQEFKTAEKLPAFVADLPKISKNMVKDLEKRDAEIVRALNRLLKIAVDNNGNVGIGTSSPNAKLDVASGEVRLPGGAGGGGYVTYFNYGGNNRNYVRGTTIIADTGGNVGFGTSSPTALCDVNSDIFRLRTAKTPASAGASGNAGDICWDANYVYVCVATNTWKRAALSAW